jgi:hypothetical protein
MSLLSVKQIKDLVERLETRHDAPIPLDDATMVKFYGASPHVLIRSQMAGCEGELVISGRSLGLLGQVLLELGREEEPPVKKEK